MNHAVDNEALEGIEEKIQTHLHHVNIWPDEKNMRRQWLGEWAETRVPDLVEEIRRLRESTDKLLEMAASSGGLPRDARVSGLDVAVARVEKLINTKVCEFRLVHRQIFGPGNTWCAGFGRMPGDTPKKFYGAWTPAEAINKACDEVGNVIAEEK